MPPDRATQFVALCCAFVQGGFLVLLTVHWLVTKLRIPGMAQRVGLAWSLSVGPEVGVLQTDVQITLPLWEEGVTQEARMPKNRRCGLHVSKPVSLEIGRMYHVLLVRFR